MPNPSAVTFGSGFWLNSSTGQGPALALSPGITAGTFYTVQLVENQSISGDQIIYTVNIITTGATPTTLGTYTATFLNVGTGYNQPGQVGVFTRDKNTAGTTKITNMHIIHP